MSNMYAIKEDTLSALGDAVRSKALGTSELPGLEVKDKIVLYNRGIPYSLPDYVKKVKITGFITYSNPVEREDGYEVGNSNGIQGLGIASGAFGENDHILVRQDESYQVLFEGFSKQTIVPTKTVEFAETIIEGNKWTFVATVNSSSPENIYLTFTAVGLDENGNEFKYTPLEMVDKINDLETIQSEALTITGDCSYRFSNGGWDWFINQFGDKITTNNITTTSNMFYNTGLKKIPFDINVSSDIVNIQNTFSYATKLEVAPYIIGPEKELPTNSYSGTLNLSYLFNNCQKLRYIPKDYFWKMVPNKDFWETQFNISIQSQECIFGYCYSLRELPNISMLGGNWTSVYSSFYYNLLQFCYSLDEATNIPVCGTFTSNAMSNLFYNNYRLKEFIFLMNEDDTPKTAKWKNQTIDTTSNSSKGTLGYGNYSPTNYNAGITEDKEVKDDATYQALKNDPDWYSRDINYSRYNHNSAVNTINSLPDTSAYGTNIIKFKGQAGALTDGGAINTLTEEEIAVAAAKGWTVSLVL